MKSFKDFVKEADIGNREKAVKDEIKREKVTDRKRWDRALDKARIDDVKFKNRNTK